MKEYLVSRDRLEQAAEIVYQVMPATAQYSWPLLSEHVGTEVWVKHENHTPVGAFKLRGGLTYFDALARGPSRPGGVISATRGNHGQSVAFAARRHGLPATIVVPHGNSREKNAAMRALGAELIDHGDDFQSAREHAGRLARDRGLHMVPSFHPSLVHGVASYSLELLRALPELDAAYVPIGLGSGVCGMIAAREALGLRLEIVGVVSRQAPAYALSFAQRRPVEHPVSTRLADGMACRAPEPDALDILQRHLARVVEVSDDEVAEAMRVIYASTHNVAEGAGAAGLAAIVKERDRVRGKTVAFVLSGGNVDRDVYAEVLSTSN